MHEDVPLINCIVNDALVDVTPHLLQTLFQFVCYLQRIFNKNQKLKQTISMQVMCNKTKCVQKSNFLVHFLQDLQ